MGILLIINSRVSSIKPSHSCPLEEPNTDTCATNTSQHLQNKAMGREIHSDQPAKRAIVKKIQFQIIPSEDISSPITGRTGSTRNLWAEGYLCSFVTARELQNFLLKTPHWLSREIPTHSSQAEYKAVGVSDPWQSLLTWHVWKHISSTSAVDKDYLHIPDKPSINP